MSTGGIDKHTTGPSYFGTGDSLDGAIYSAAQAAADRVKELGGPIDMEVSRIQVTVSNPNVSEYRAVLTETKMPLA